MSKKQERLDKIMASSRERLQEEVSALLGKTLTFAEPETKILTKEEFFSEPAGKSVLAHVKLDGDLDGEGCLIVPIRDAIRIGGTLIMLPESELNSVIGDEEYSEELEDSYGEIANIICGSLTSIFEEQFPKTFRLVRTEQEVILPVKVDVESDDPVPNGSYYLMTSAMGMENVEMGTLQLLLPAASFGLVDEPEAEAEEKIEEKGEKVTTADDSATEDLVSEQPKVIEREASEPEEKVQQKDRPASNDEQEAATPVKAKAPKDVKKQKERLDKIMVSCRERLQEEVSALLGKTLTFAKPETKVLTKKEFFSEPAGKSVLAHVELDGDLEGEGCLIVPIRDAIRIGGTLIMLPESELNAVMGDEEYSEELEDSYGEIANIICGSLTSIFEEQFPKTFRLVRTEQEVILPVKVDVESDDPVPDGLYYLMTSAIGMDDHEMGTLQLLLPAASFGLVEEQVEDSSRSDVAATSSPENDQPEIGESPAAVPEQEVSPSAPVKSPDDVKKQQERIELLLNTSLAKIGEEIGALLGGTLAITPETNEVLNKEELLEQVGGKQVMARMDVRGEGEGEAYLFVSLKDAIFLGGTLIMLPDAELEEVVRNEEFGEDAEDAYGEVANIIAGVYTSIFEEQYRKKLGFVKTSLETIIPVKVDPDSDEVIPNDIYYLSSGELSFNGQGLGRIQAVFSASLFELESLAQSETVEEAEPPPQAVSQAGEGQGTSVPPVSGTSVQAAGAGADAADILIFTDDDVEAKSIAAILGQQGYTPRILHYRDPVGSYLTPAISLVFLIMKDISEQGFGMAIKLSSSGIQVPLVAAGPAWTRTTVLKAVKYGAADILITPAATGDIQEKLDMNLVKKAA